MKKYISLALMLLYMVKGQAQTNTIVRGVLPDLKPGTPVYVNVMLGTKKDSTIAMEGGKFEIKLNVPKGSMYMLNIGKELSWENTLSIYLEPGVFELTGVGTLLKDAKYSGSQYVADYIRVNQHLNKSHAERVNLMKEKNQATEDNDQSKVALIDSKLKNIDSLDKRWVIENKSSSAGAIALQSLIGRMSMDELEAYYHTLTPSARNNTMADKVIDAVNASRSLKTGNMAPDFTNKNILGEPVSLSSFKGKYVLLDFWASWCGPCRKGHPNLKKAYEQFKGKNFDILSVSLDDDRERWMDAIKKDGLTWTQVSDLNAWSNIATRKFMIQGIPTNFLISPEGKIIARDLHGEELLRKLETIF